MAKKALPEKFVENIKAYLGESEGATLIESLSSEPFAGLRINMLKVSVEKYTKMAPFSLAPVPWCRDGFYLNGSVSPGRHPHYYAGLYYIQEPSAMFPVEVLAPLPGESVLDLCAAPGGKTVQISARMGNEGFLLSNDVDPKRVRALMKNIELCGVKNAFLSCKEPVELARSFPSYFDAILVDAPCSGEGMFRRDEYAVKSWLRHAPGSYAQRQLGLLNTAVQMLKPGGRMVYSTCTFSPEENEKVIEAFLHDNPGFRLMSIDLGMQGRSGIECGDFSGTARLWPHKLQGEGHFCALLSHQSDQSRLSHQSHQSHRVPQGRDTSDHGLDIAGRGPQRARGRRISATPKVRALECLPPAYEEFVHENLSERAYPKILREGCGIFCAEGGRMSGDRMSGDMTSDGRLFLAPSSSDGLPIHNAVSGMFIKTGLFLGTYTAARFEPSHSLALYLEKSDFKRVLELSSDSVETLRYLKGETLLTAGEKGLTAVCIDGYPAGWAGCDGSSYKNLYPPGWRMMK